MAQGVTGLLAAQLLAVDTDTPIRAGESAAPANTRRENKDDTQILRRNIFDSETGPLDGEPVVEVAEVVPDDEPVEFDPSAPPPPCDGSMRLVAAVVHPRGEQWSFAAIVGAAGKAMVYRPGQSLDEREVVAVLPNRVVLRQTSGFCQLEMFGEAVAAAAPPTRPNAAARVTPVSNDQATPVRPVREGAISSSDMESGISRVNDTTFNVQRGLVDNILENQAELMRTARIIPHEENGRVVGVKMYGIRRNSLLGRLGVQNGDMLRTINGYDMSSPDTALEAYTRLRSADHLTLSIVRRGQPATLDYNIQAQ